MRENRFRVWDKLEERYRLDVLMDTSGKVFFNDGYGLQTIPPDQIIVEFFTGLEDIHYAKIYEGDIIEANIIEFTIKTMGEIVFDNYFSFYANKNEAGNTPLYRLNKIEIIGSIHKNPELLKNP